MAISVRRPEISLGIGLATATIAYTIYSQGLPNQAEVRAAPAGDDNLDAVRTQRLWLAAATVGAVSLLARDETIFILGAGSLVAMDWLTRMNAWTNPLEGRIDLNPFTTEREATVMAEDVAGAEGYAALSAVP